MQATRGKAQRIVVYRLGSLGDTVVALPCLHRVAQAFPDAERIVLTNFPISSKAAPLEAILGGSGLVHRFVAYPLATRSFAALWALRATLRALEADTLVYLTPSRGLKVAWRDRIYFRLCGFTRLIGVPVTRDLQENRRGADGLIEFECARLARCMAELGDVDLDDRAAWSLALGSDERATAAAAVAAAGLKPRIAVNLGCKVAENDWGEANWLALVANLRAVCGDHALVFIGAAEDSGRAERVGQGWPGPVLNLCGQVSPRVSAAAMAGSRFFIGHDSGPLHLAACMNVVCVGLYGNKNEPRKWHPYGGAHHIIHEMRGVLAIEVQRVEAAVRAVLAETAASLATARVDAGPAPMRGAPEASAPKSTAL